MANNVQAETVSTPGVRFVTAELTQYGDASAHAPGCFLGIVSGSEGAQTFTEYVGGAGAVTAGTQRVTLASDDPAVTSLAVLDDWDESDRAKVNLIVGQAGIAAGAGAVGATVPRVTLASDDPGVALLTTIDADTSTLAGLVLATQADDVANTSDGLQTTAFGYAFDGTTWDRMRGDSTNGLLVNLGSNNDVTVSGVSTLAEQQSQTTLLGTIDADTSSLAGCVGGAEVQVDIVGSLPAGTNGIGKLTANSGVDIGDVDVTSVVPGTGATNLGKAIDSAAGATDTGVAMLAIHDATTSSLSAAEGDWVPMRVDANGRLHVKVEGTVSPGDGLVPIGLGVVSATMVYNGTNWDNCRGDATNGTLVNLGSNNDVTVTSGTIDLGATDNAVLDAIAASLAGTLTVGSHAVTNAGTFAVQVDGSALTSLQLIDDAIFADDAAFTLASSKVMVAGAIRDDSLSTLTAVEGDAVPLRVSSTGALHVTGAGGGTQYNVDDVAGATDTGTLLLAIRDDSLATLTPADGDYVGLRVSSTGALHVTGGGGGTEYTEDVATANPIVGTATMMERDDALGGLTPIEGDWASMRCDANGALWVAVNSSALPSGAATSANQTTIIGHVDGIEGLLTTIDGDTGALAACASGTELQVDVITLPALAAGTNNIGDVDVLSIVPGTGATNLGKAEDAVHSTGDTGVYVLAVRDDTLGAHSGTDGDYESLHTNANGALWTIDVNSATISTNIATLAGAVSGTEMQVDVLTLPALAAGTNNIGDVDILSIAAGDNNIGNVDVVTLPALPAGTNNIGDVDVLSIVPGTAATNLGKAEDAAHTTGDTGVYMLAVRDDSPAAHSGTDGDYESLHVSAEGGLWATDTGSASGGLTTFRSIDLDESEEEVKATAGTIYHIAAFNRTAAPLYLKLYNLTAANTTVGSSTPTHTYVIPANADSDGAGFMLDCPKGIAFSTAISAAVTTAVSDADTGAPGANDAVVVIQFK